MIKKLLVIFTISASLQAAVFDYRVGYGSTSSQEEYVTSYSACIYSYLENEDLAFGSELDLLPIKVINNDNYLTSLSLLVGYDFSQELHGEITAGPNLMINDFGYSSGYHAGITFLYQVDLSAFMEAIQVGYSVTYDGFSSDVVENETQSKILVGFGF